MARARRRGTALTIVPRSDPRSEEKPDPKPQQEPKPEPQAEALPVAQDLIVPAALMLAAVSVSAPTTETGRPWLRCIYLHSVDGRARAVAADGPRLFVSSFAIVGETPDWLAEGLMVDNEDIKPQLSMIAKAGDGQVRISYGRGLPHIEISDTKRRMVFRRGIQGGTFPEYQRIIPDGSFVTLDDNGNPVGKEWEPVGINSRYLKHLGDLAKTLEGGLPKAERDKRGMVVRAFNSGGDSGQPLVFDFLGWPGVILVVGTQKLATPDTAPETAALLAPAIKRTVAALRAHATRWLMVAEATHDPQEKAMAMERVASFHARVAGVLKRAPGLTAIQAEQDEVEPQPAPEPEQDEDADEDADEDEEAA